MKTPTASRSNPSSISRSAPSWQAATRVSISTLLHGPAATSSFAWDVDLGPNGYRCSTLSQALPEQLLVLPHISVLARPETRKRLIDQGFQVRELPADKFAAFIAAERAKWAKSA
jgi:hypothetical protein